MSEHEEELIKMRRVVIRALEIDQGGDGTECLEDIFNKAFYECDVRLRVDWWNDKPILVND